MRIAKYHIPYLSLILMALLLSAGAAQAQTFTVVGRLMQLKASDIDTSAVPVVGNELMLRSQADTAPMISVTDVDGFYSFKKVPRGLYYLEIIPFARKQQTVNQKVKAKPVQYEVAVDTAKVKRDGDQILVAPIVLPFSMQ